ncbi:MAG: RNA polymerase sigma factor [Terriglobia bacterium]|nr:RNA polymerase sigma factor [Terriglobia bacterium]
MSKTNGQRVTVSEEPAVADFQASDEVLLAHICDGDDEALTLLFRRYARLVRAVAYRVLRDTSEADDLVQDIFLLVHRKCTTFDSGKSPARFWILQMTYHRAISRRRYLESRYFYTQVNLEDASTELPNPSTTTRGYADSIDGVLGNGGLERMFQGLSENQRQTLQLHFLEGYSLDEIATELGQSRGNVKHHYFRGLEKLRKHIFGSKIRSDCAV